MGGWIHTLLYIVSPNHVKLITIIWRGVGIIHTPPLPDTRLILLPPTLPRHVYNTCHYFPSRLFINHAINFSYTYPAIFITTSYSMVGVRWLAVSLRRKFVYISAITLLLFFTCIVFPSHPIVSLSSSIDVLSIYSHFFFGLGGVIYSCHLYHFPPPLFSCFLLYTPSLLRAFPGNFC